MTLTTTLGKILNEIHIKLSIYTYIYITHTYTYIMIQFYKNKKIGNSTWKYT